MADNEATRALFRELLGMTGGANASGRGTLHIPDDIMDSLAGDAAQDELARNNLIMEMKNREGRRHDPRFVSLDLMEMEAGDVDSFLAMARKKIIKRSKPTRKACCTRIGGALDQMMGPLGGDYADAEDAEDRGKKDPIGGADGMAEAVEDDFLRFITEEFFPFEHDADCPLADPKFTLDEGEHRYFATPKRRGLLREHFHLAEGAGIPLDKAKAALSMLRKKKAAGQLAGKEAALLPKLEKFVAMAGKGEDKGQQQEEEVTMEPSRTANALSSFMEAADSVDRYKAADAGSGKGSPDSMSTPDSAGQLSLKTRDDNKQYPTDLTPVKSGTGRVAGDPKPLSTRGKDRGDPIGEDAGGRISETASALANFMEANYQYAEAKKRLAGYGDDAGDLELKKRPEQKLGGPLQPAKSAYPKSDEKPRYEKGADPRGDAHDKGAGKN